MTGRAWSWLSAPTLAISAALLTPATALGCPACAARSDGGPTLLLAYAAMVLSPFLASLVVIRVVKNMTSRDVA